MATTESGGRIESEEELVEAFLTALVSGDAGAMADLVTEDCVLHQPRWPLEHVGREAVVAEAASLAGAFTDVEIALQQSVLDGDRIAAYVTASGRNVGPMSMEGRTIAPTGNAFAVPQFGIYRVADGRVAEAWVLADALGIVEQLDNFPAGPVKLLEIALRQVRWRLGGRRRLD